MAVYARGYRTYQGGFKAAPPWWTMFREGYRAAFRSKGFRFVGILFLIWFIIWGAVLYFTLGIEEVAREVAGGEAKPLDPVRELTQALAQFYGGIAVLGALLAMLVGSGLVSEDLRTRALPLYLVRPIRPSDYMIGKALILPGILIWLALLPGLLYYLLVGMWQPPGQTGTFLAENLEIPWLVVKQYFVAACSYTGLMLFLSTKTPRRGAVMGIAAAVLFGGTMLYGIGSRLRGTLGDVFRHMGIPVNFEMPYALAHVEARHGVGRRLERLQSRSPDPEAVLVISAALLLLGLWSVWRRARTVEVSA